MLLAHCKVPDMVCVITGNKGTVMTILGQSGQWYWLEVRVLWIASVYLEMGTGLMTC